MVVIVGKMVERLSAKIGCHIMMHGNAFLDGKTFITRITIIINWAGATSGILLFMWPEIWQSSPTRRADRLSVYALCCLPSGLLVSCTQVDMDVQMHASSMLVVQMHLTEEGRGVAALLGYYADWHLAEEEWAVMFNKMVSFCLYM